MERDAKSAAVVTSDNATVPQRLHAAVKALDERHLRRVGYALPGTRIGVSSWPPAGRFASKQRLTASWNYWWQAHLIDVLVNAAKLQNDKQSAKNALRLIRGVRVRNSGKWTNSYYDDMAWLSMAIERADRHLPALVKSDHKGALATLTSTLYKPWAPDLGGGIPWRTTDYFFNVPANGPAAIFLARRGKTDRAKDMVDWIYQTMLLPSGLIADGFWRETGDDGQVNKRYINTVYTYCQGVVFGALLEVYRATGDASYVKKIDDLLTAVTDNLTTDGVIHGGGGGDGGLFDGILARNLALIATDLPDAAPGTGSAASGPDLPSAADLRKRAGDIVLKSADACWATRTEVDGLPLFSADWTQKATVPSKSAPAAQFVAGAVHSSATPERDMSVQVSAATLLAAAQAVTDRSPEHNG
ncbi:MAG: glycoside hydrolase family 76 protein [Gordonia sp. (in: high G+C Gram-positive bacteria)]|uniref:glycoside hydrolase family 76 protein n=1 Tax=Gordonia sp. (in: high G+C Gram-positive bacteria) TaxID=84139 RepID=UPI0039E70454